MVSQVNAARLAAGKSALGWINPSLYALASSIVLNDVTSGINNCVANDIFCCTQGFHATSGWDPVTGIGSVNYTAFQSAFFALGSTNPTAMPTNGPVGSNSSGSDRLSNGAVAGLVIGVSVFTALASGLAVFFFMRGRVPAPSAPPARSSKDIAMNPMSGSAV